MKAVRKTIIATSLFALPGLASALGLGNIDVKSGLNEPLMAEIRVLAAGPEEQQGLRVGLARPEDFANVGLDYSRLSMDLEFAVATNDRGETVVRVTSREVIREPFLSLLVEVNWAKGRLLREYSLLMDPPVMASARQGAKVTAQPVVEPAPAVTESVPAPEPVAVAPVPEPEPVAAAPVESPPVEPVASEPPPPEPVAEAAPAEPTPEPAPAEPYPVEPAPVEPVPEPAPVPTAAGAGEYGPVLAGDNLYQIALKTRPDASVSVDQMMVSILRMNGQAFYQDNINALKTGAILRIPGSADVVSVEEARAAVQEHNALWGSYQTRASENPALVSDAGSASVAAESSSGLTAADRLELVAPRTGDSQGGADRPNGQANAASAEQLERTRSELALVKEDLASAQRESDELKSRVKELEGINQNRDSLIRMKDDEIAELERRIQQLQDAAAQTPASVSSAPSIETSTLSEASSSAAELASSSSAAQDPSTATATSSEPAISKEDIWGESLPASSSSADSLATTTSDPAATDAGSASSMALSDGTATSDPATETAPTSEDSAIASSEAALPDTTVSSAATSTETTPVSEPVPANTAPVAAEPSFFEQYWMYLAGGGGLLLLLGLLIAMRKPKTAAAPADYAEPQQELPLDGFMAAAPAPAPYTGTPTPQPFEAFDADPEMALRSQIESDPDNLGAHLELLRLFYGRNDPDAFEDAAQAMRSRLYDTNAPEWKEAQAMGEVLVPHSSLFASAPDFSQSFGTMELPPIDTPKPSTLPPGNRDDDGLGDLDLGAFDVAPPAQPVAAAVAPAPAQEFDFELNLDGPTKRVEAVKPPPAQAPAPANDDLSFDFNFDLDAPAPAPAPVTAQSPAFAAPVAPSPAPAPSFEPSTLDLPDFNFDADIKPVEKVSFEPTELAPAVVPVVTSELAAPEIIREPELPALDDPLFQSEDAVGTKLDLARAYLDMGDPDGARSMLEEVMIEGDDRQQTEARELLSRLG